MSDDQLWRRPPDPTSGGSSAQQGPGSWPVPPQGVPPQGVPPQSPSAQSFSQQTGAYPAAPHGQGAQAQPPSWGAQQVGQGWPPPGIPPQGIPHQGAPLQPRPPRRGPSATMVVFGVVMALIAAFGIYLMATSGSGAASPSTAPTNWYPAPTRTPTPEPVTTEPSAGPTRTTGPAFDAPPVVDGWIRDENISDDGFVSYDDPDATTIGRFLLVAAQPTEDLDSASQQLGEPISSYRSGTMLCGEDTLGLMVSCYVETPRYGLIEVTGFQGSVSVDEVSRFTDALADAVA
jgi:hypothetical protein